MKIIDSPYKGSTLPIQIKISFEKIYEFLEEMSTDENSFYQNAAKEALTEFNKYPILRDGFTDVSLLDKYRTQINNLLDVLFPELLQSNEIKAVSIPFDFTTFKLSDRFAKIIENAGDDYVLSIRDFEENSMYILSCTFVIAYYYNYNLDFKRPFFYDIPNIHTGETKHYRAVYNGDFFKIIKTKNAPEITQEQILSLLDNFGNIEKWKELFPPESYILKGFGLTTLFDVTQDQMLSNLKENLLKIGPDSIHKVRQNLATIYNIPDIHFGFTLFDPATKRMRSIEKNNVTSLILSDSEKTCCSDYFCSGLSETLIHKHEIVAISNIEEYGKATNNNSFYKSLKSKNIQSIILVPLATDNKLYGIMELGSEKKHELNSINANKLKDIVPMFKIASQRAREEHDNKLESIIQENYTSIHPSVKWRFLEAAETHLNLIENGNTSTDLEEIVFENVFPLYGQSDIKGSSTARNIAIQQDLSIQLNAVIKIIDQAFDTESLPIYKELIYRTQNHISEIESGLKTGDEQSITNFLTLEVAPILDHFSSINSDLKQKVSTYKEMINPELKIVYQKRKEYEEYVTVLNNKLASYIDEQQEEAQKMFPHYFERYKTDGVDFNMYIGQSLVEDKKFDNLYLQNLRLWQLKLICELEQIVHELKINSQYSLDIASLILVHSNPLAIKFRMDEKQFDVDGAYNIRYEIIKKRIDKAHIKNTTERITQPDKIAIIYSQDSDKKEYLRYIHYLQSKDFLLNEIEDVELEDLQGISGLRALRIPLNYKSPKENISFEDLMNVIKQ
jgi:hypothetical protein